MKLKDKKVVITGASLGIGLEVLKLLLNENAYVLAVSRTMSKNPIEHERLIKVDLDLSLEDSPYQLLELAYKKLGDIDKLISNADFTYYERLKVYDSKQVMDIFNLNLFQTIKLVTKLMLNNPSLSGHLNLPFSSL